MKNAIVVSRELRHPCFHMEAQRDQQQAAAAWRNQPKWVVSRSLNPVVLDHGKPYFSGPRPPLRLMTHGRIGEDVIRLTYAPA